MRWPSRSCNEMLADHIDGPPSIRASSMNSAAAGETKTERPRQVLRIAARTRVVMRAPS